MKHVNLKTISLKTHPQLDEKWLQDVNAKDPNFHGPTQGEFRDANKQHNTNFDADMLLPGS